MSESSIINLSENQIIESYYLKMVEFGDAYLLNKRFMVGKKVDIGKVTEFIRLKRFLQFSECLSEIDRDELLQKIKKITLK